MIYADYNATSPLPEEVRRAMEPFLSRNFANPSHDSGKMPLEARRAIEAAREQVAALVGASPDEIVFLSGGSESCSHALLGALAARPQRSQIVYSDVEHPAVREAAQFAAGPLIKRDILELKPEKIPSALSPSTAVASLMLANNESGIIYDLSETVEAGKRCGAVVHSDATQAVGRIPVDFKELGLDLLSLSGHKIGGPKGVGALVVGQSAEWLPVAPAGGQEHGRRGGTQAVALIAGFGAAARLAAEQLRSGEAQRIQHIRDLFEEKLKQLFAQCSFVGGAASRLPNTSGVTLPGVMAQELVAELAEQEVYISSGSACSSQTADPSRVMLALGLSTAEALSTVRVSFGWQSSAEQAERLAEAIAKNCSAYRRRLESQLNFRTTGEAHDKRI